MSEQRHKTGEKLMAATREKLPGAAVRWLAAVREPLEILTMAALSADVSDTQFTELVEDFSASLPGLMETMDHEALAELLEASMGAAMANGLTARDKQEKRAKLPWEADAYLAAQKRRKNGEFGEGDGPGGGKDENPLNIGKLMEGSEASIKQRAKEAMKALPKVLSHPETGFEFEMNGDAIRKTLQQAIGKGKGAPDLTAATQMGKIFLDSKKNPPEPDRKNHHGVKAFHTFSTRIRVGGVNREAIITVTEYEPNNDPSKQIPHFKVFRLRSMKKGT